MAINIPIISSLNTKGFDSAKKEFQSLQGFGAKSGFLLQKAMLPAAGAVTALAGGLGMAAKAAAEDEKSSNLLAQQLKRTLGANDEVTASMAAFVDKTQLATNVTDQELRPALATLVRFTGNAKKAQDLLTLSVDASVATGKDLTSISTALGKAYDGNFTALKKLGIPLDENIIKTKDFEGAQKALMQQFGGAAAANMNTFEGRLKNVKIRFDEFVETIGYKVLPIVDSLLRSVTKLVDAYSAKGLGGVLSSIKDSFLKATTSADGQVTAQGRLYNGLVRTRNMFTRVANGLKEFSNDVSWGKTNFRITELKNTIGTDFKKQLDASVFSMKEMAKALNLVSVMGPVASRNLSEFRKYALDMAPVLAQERLDKLAAAEEAAGKAATAAGIANDKAKEKTAAHTAKLKRQAEVAKEAAKALAEDYARALENAVQLVKDKFAPALMRANDQLTKATENYNNFYNATADVVRGIFNVGEAWTTAADSEGAKSFFGVLDEQATKAGQLAAGIENLIAAGLDDPELLKSILDSGADVGLEIIKGLLAGGKASIDRLLGISTTINAAADRIAKLTADKWFKSGVDQAQKIVEGVNSVIADTEFLLQFAIDPESVAAIGAQLDASLGTIFGGGAAPAPTTNPFGPVLGSINASPNMGGGRVSAASVGDSNVTINVNGGDPNAVVSALRTYMRQNGSVPIKVSNIY
jgi:hypothetical protein